MASPVEPIPEDLDENGGMFRSSRADPCFSYLKMGTHNSITGIFRWGPRGAFSFQFLSWVYLAGSYYSMTVLTYNGEGREGAKCWKGCVCVCACVRVHVSACMSPAPGHLDGLPDIGKVQGHDQRPACNFCLCGSCPPLPLMMVQKQRDKSTWQSPPN